MLMAKRNGRSQVRWGFYKEDADMRPLRRIGGLHELVPTLDPEQHG